MSFGSAPAQPKPAPFYPIDIAATAGQATAADIQAYNLSDQDFASRFPGLVAARNYSLQSGLNELNGPLDPTIESGFVREGMIGARGAFGEGSTDSGAGGLDPGSAGRNTVAKTMARDILSKQDTDRQYISFLTQQNPERAFGLSGEDIANLNIFNTGNANQSVQNAYATQVAGIQDQSAQNIQQMQLISGLLTSLAGTYARSQQPSDERLKAKLVWVGMSASRIPIYVFSYIGIAGRRFIGALAKDVAKVFPTAVSHDPHGYDRVDYSLTDVVFRELGAATAQ